LSLEAGWVVHISGGTGAGSIAAIDSVDVAGGQTTIVLRHVFENGPANGSTLLIGPWSYGQFAYTMPTTSADYRGPKITTPDAGTTMLLGYSAWVVDESDNAVPGFAFSPIGWGGNGYKPQLDEAIDDSVPRLMCEAHSFDAVMMHGAFQSSVFADMEAFAAIIAQSGAQPILCGDMVHSLTSAGWSSSILGQSTYAALVATEATGSYDHHVAVGEKYDPNHPSLPGMRSLAENMLVLAEAEYVPTFNASNICVALANDGGALRPAIRFDVAGDAVKLRTSYGEGTAGSTRLDVLGLDSGGSVLPDPSGKSIDISTTMTIGELLEEIAGVSSVANIQLATGISLDDLAQSVLGDDSTSWESTDDTVGYAFSTVECVIGGGGRGTAAAMMPGLGMGLGSD
jgi:hypothetical protein